MVSLHPIVLPMISTEAISLQGIFAKNMTLRQVEQNHREFYLNKSKSG